MAHRKGLSQYQGGQKGGNDSMVLGRAEGGNDPMVLGPGRPERGEWPNGARIREARKGGMTQWC